MSQEHCSNHTKIRKGRAEQMDKKRIAFGWTGTLVPELGEFRCIRPSGPGRLFYKPHLRVGALELMRALQNDGWEIWIYTLAALPQRRLQLFFAANGIRLGGIITQTEHLRAYKAGKAPQANLKHAPAFGLTVLADDKPLTAQAGKRYGFATLQITTCLPDWTAPIRQFCLEPAATQDQEQEPEPLALAA
jgi:hypothetical protein